MDYVPPGRVQRFGGRRFPRYVIRDSLGQYWAGEERRWSDNPSDSVLFCRELDAMLERNRCCLGDGKTDSFKVTVVLVVHGNRWTTKQLARHLKRHRRLAIGGPAGKGGLLLEIMPSTLKKVREP